MSSDVLNIAVVGAGFMGRKHTEFVAANPAAQVSAIVDPFSNTLATELGVPHYSTMQELFHTQKPDGVIIVNPTDQHLPAALEALEAGVPTLLEKPVTPTFAESVELIQRSESSDVPILIGHHRRHNASAIRAKEFVASGGLGQLVGVNGTWTNKKNHDYYDVEWHRTKGGGVMLINLIHDLDLLRFLCGEIVAIQAKTSNSVRGHEVDETVVTIFEFENGALGAFLATDTAPGPWSWDQGTEDFDNFPYSPDSMTYQLLGTEGSLSVPNLAHYAYPDRNNGNWFEPLQKDYLQRGSLNTYHQQMAHFVDVIRGDVTPSVTVRDAAISLALIEAANLAAVEGREVRLADFLAQYGV